MVTVIKKVPKPTVTVEPLFCSSTSSLCKLSCNGAIQEAQPITYSWRPNTGNWTESSKLMDITNDDNHVENFFCQMKNPVSEEESEPWKNVFYPEKVPKPTVALEPLSCSPSSPPCALSCNGGIPEAEPITYSWRRDTGDWTESSKLMDITNDDDHVENFFCQMKNPVSEEESEPWKNVFYKDRKQLYVAVAVGVVAAVILVVFIAFITRRFVSLRGGSVSEIGRLNFYFNVLAMGMTVVLPFFSLGFAFITGRFFSFLSGFDSEIGTLMLSLGVLVGVMAAVPLFFWLVDWTRLLSHRVLAVVLAVVSLGCSLGSAVIAGKVFSLRGGFDSEIDELLLYLGVVAVVMAAVSLVFFLGSAVIAGKIFSSRSRNACERGQFIFLHNALHDTLRMDPLLLCDRFPKVSGALTPAEEEALEGPGALTPAEEEALEGPGALTPAEEEAEEEAEESPGALTPAEEEALEGPGALTPAEEEALEGPGALTPAEEEALEGPGAPTPAEEEALEGPGAPTPAEEEALEGPGAPTPAEEEALEGPGAPTPAEEEALEGPGAPTPAEEEALEGSRAPTPAEDEAATL
ncbi:uncharacterized protein LOC115371006 [Myripristis murdjan]|uniref:uncharacterized protein LOC115371006 n=1 Tax=Myripristis murdjan TaxID=586833 RepID=UPI0011761460|nr:uncharacterized protein LOC115371006 [Myripristis murdjan]